MGSACRTWESIRFHAESPCSNILAGTGNPNSLDRTLVASIYEDRQGILWVGTSRALNRIDRKTGQHTAYRTPDLVQYRCDSRSRRRFGHSLGGHIWPGLKRFDRGTGQFQDRRDIRLRPFNRVSFGCSAITPVHVWALSWNDLKRFDHWQRALDRVSVSRAKRDRERGRVSEFQRFAWKFALSIAEDRKGSLWLGAPIWVCIRLIPRLVNSRSTNPTAMIPIF